MNRQILLAILLVLTISATAQTKKHSDKDYAKKPYWIQMMDIEGVNYKEVLKAYTIYWKHHSLPEEEADRYIGKGNQAKEKLSKKELKERREGEIMRFQIKKFEHWKIKNESFVKENGNVMTANERLKIIQQNQ